MTRLQGVSIPDPGAPQGPDNVSSTSPTPPMRAQSANPVRVHLPVAVDERGVTGPVVASQGRRVTQDGQPVAAHDAEYFATAFGAHVRDGRRGKGDLLKAWCKAALEEERALCAEAERGLPARSNAYVSQLVASMPQIRATGAGRKAAGAIAHVLHMRAITLLLVLEPRAFAGGCDVLVQAAAAAASAKDSRLLHAVAGNARLAIDELLQRGLVGHADMARFAALACGESLADAGERFKAREALATTLGRVLVESPPDVRDEKALAGAGVLLDNAVSEHGAAFLEAMDRALRHEAGRNPAALRGVLELIVPRLGASHAKAMADAAVAGMFRGAPASALPYVQLAGVLLRSLARERLGSQLRQAIQQRFDEVASAHASDLRAAPPEAPGQPIACWTRWRDEQLSLMCALFQACLDGEEPQPFRAYMLGACVRFGLVDALLDADLPTLESRLDFCLRRSASAADSVQTGAGVTDRGYWADTAVAYACAAARLAAALPADGAVQVRQLMSRLMMAMGKAPEHFCAPTRLRLGALLVAHGGDDMKGYWADQWRRGDFGVDRDAMARAFETGRPLHEMGALRQALPGLDGDVLSIIASYDAEPPSFHDAVDHAAAALRKKDGGS
jgi:hypothetical protein